MAAIPGWPSTMTAYLPSQFDALFNLSLRRAFFVFDIHALQELSQRFPLL